MTTLILEKVISGGQTGVDRAALASAKLFGFRTGGWMPAGFRSLDKRGLFVAQDFGLEACETSSYRERTYKNVRESDGTLRLARDFLTSGELCTVGAITKYRKPQCDITEGQYPPLATIRDWLVTHSIRVLNVAGNSEQSAPGIHNEARRFFDRLFEALALLRSVPPPYETNESGPCPVCGKVVAFYAVARPVMHAPARHESIGGLCPGGLS